MEEPGGHHLNQVMEVKFISNGTNLNCTSQTQREVSAEDAKPERNHEKTSGNIKGPLIKQLDYDP